MRLLLPLLLCVACVGARFDEEAERQRWFERIEFESRDDEPELLIVWDGSMSVAGIQTVQFALWSDGHAVWSDGDVFEPPRSREFRCTPQELGALRTALAAHFSGPFESGPLYPCSSAQLILWRTGGPVRGIESGWGNVSAHFARSDAPPDARALAPTPADWDRLPPEMREVLHDQAAIEAAVVELVERHPEARATSALRLVVR